MNDYTIFMLHRQYQREAHAESRRGRLAREARAAARTDQPSASTHSLRAFFRRVFVRIARPAQPRTPVHHATSAL